MENHNLLLGFLVICCLAMTSYGLTFSSLNQTLVVTATPSTTQVLKAGRDTIRVEWSYNQSFPAGTDSTYKTVKIKLCYAPISQKDRGWRKIVDIIAKDKTCQHKVVTKPYSPSNNTLTWTVPRDVPTATYFVRAYVYGSNDDEAAYGQSTDAHKTTNLLTIEAVSGRHLSLDIASLCFSAFSVVSLFGFFYLEKRKAKLAQQK